MLKNIDKKYLYILGVFLGLPIIIVIFLMLMKGCSGSKGTNYSSYENKMVSAAEKYFKENGYPELNSFLTVGIDELVKSTNLKSVDVALKEKNCSGSVTVRNNGGFYLYTPLLECDKYKTTYIVDKLKENIVTEKSGLYQVGDSYIFKGSKVNNYVSFFDKKYMIISIDENNIMKLVKLDQEKESIIWDNKYNIEKKQTVGVNDFSDSKIFDELLKKYDKVKDLQKKHLIGYNICYGNRSLSYENVDNVNECSQRLENQYYSLMNTYDFANASYDSNCTGFNKPSCRNYNYIYDNFYTTWLVNGNLDNTYEVYYYAQGYIDVSRANNSKKVNLVIYLDGNELYSKGDGSFDKPYVIK